MQGEITYEISAAINTLKDNGAEDGETKVITETVDALDDISKKHSNYLSNVLEDNRATARKYDEVNGNYKQFVDQLGQFQTEWEDAEDDEFNPDVPTSDNPQTDDDNNKPTTDTPTTDDNKDDLTINPDDNKKPNVNTDTDGDGKPDLNIDTDDDGKPNINIDTDGDGKPDLNIDTDGDGKPDLNIDTDGDGKPDLNIDADGDGKPDVNIDTNGDGTADLNIDTDGDGKPNVNIDTDGDGKPDKNIVGSAGAEGDGTATDQSLGGKVSNLLSSFDTAASKVNSISPDIKRITQASTNVGIIGGAGLAATAAGGGIIAKAGKRKYVFPPKYWNNQTDITKGIIIEKFQEAGFTESQIKDVTTNTLKIEVNKLDKVIIAIKKSHSLDDTCDDKIVEMYNYPIFTRENKVDKYKTLLCMIIDNINEKDKFNIYSILNSILTGTDYVDFSYNGVELEEVVCYEMNKEE